MNCPFSIDKKCEMPCSLYYPKTGECSITVGMRALVELANNSNNLAEKFEPLIIHEIKHEGGG